MGLVRGQRGERLVDCHWNELHFYLQLPGKQPGKLGFEGILGFHVGRRDNDHQFALTPVWQRAGGGGFYPEPGAKCEDNREL